MNYAYLSRTTVFIAVLHNISTLSQLLERLPDCEGQEYVELVKGMHLDPRELKPYARWSNERYTRNLIDRTDQYELILLCWEEGQDTPIHCHNNQECWVYLVEGTFNEKRFRFNEANGDMKVETDMELRAGRFSYMNDDMGYHSLHNVHQGRTMSLHLYMDPINKCRIYDPVEKVLNWKTLHYDNVEYSSD